jgi:integrase
MRDMATLSVKQLRSPTARKALKRSADKKSRIEPYYVSHRQGVSIGYRPGTGVGAVGSWVLREFKPGTPHGRYVKRTLGTADDLVPSDGVHVLSWEDAQKVAGGEERPTVTKPGRLTVTAAWEAYAATRKSPPDARERAIWATFIEPKLGSCNVSELTQHQLKKWLVDQVTTRGNRGQTLGGDKKDKLRRAQYVANRRWILLRAVLNNAFRDDLVKSDTAWRKVRPFPNVDRPRTVTASADQARELLAQLTDPLLGVATAALYTGLRLGELLGLRADDVDVAESRLRVRHGKGGSERWVPLNREGTAFFAERKKSKAADAAVFPPMTNTQVADGMVAASKAAGITPCVTMHDLRRTYGSLMLNEGAPIEVVQQVLGHSDTRMTRRTYAHLLQQTVAKAVQKYLPSFKRGKARVRMARVDSRRRTAKS